MIQHLEIGEMSESQERRGRMQVGGWAGWILARVRREARHDPRLVVRERVALAPRQHVALVEADGRRFLIATGADGAPALYPLEQPAEHRPAASRRPSW